MTKAKIALFLTCLAATLSTGCGVTVFEVTYRDTSKADTRPRYLTTHCNPGNQCYVITTPPPAP